MKNRTIIGIVCMILAVAMTFAIAPVVNRLTSDTTTVVRLKQEVGRGTKITEDQVETVKVKTDNSYLQDRLKDSYGVITDLIKNVKVVKVKYNSPTYLNEVIIDLS